MSNTTTFHSERKNSRVDQDILSPYLHEIRRIRLLSRAEEDSLARSAARGDRIAKEKLTLANLRFVVTVAKKYQNQGLPLADLISEGNIGLMKAVDRFDVKKGCHFITYAVWWIRQTMQKAICEKSRMIRLTQNAAWELVQIGKTRMDLLSEQHQGSQTEAIANRLHLDRGRLTRLLNVSSEPMSLDAPVYSETDASLVGDFVEDETRRNTEEIAIENAVRVDINTILTSLSQRDSEIIRCRYGLDGKKPMSLSELGSKYKLTRERIRQIEKRAITRLRHSSRYSLLRGCM
jgi:RNA polymerase primary sigma factor